MPAWVKSYPVGMTPEEIHSFIQRLVCRELRPGELSALTTRDLGDINLHLTEYANTDRSLSSKIMEFSTTERRPARRSYSEEEILSEFGVLE